VCKKLFLFDPWSSNSSLSFDFYKSMLGRNIPLALVCFSASHSSPFARATTEHSTRSADSVVITKTTKLPEQGKADSSLLLPRNLPAGFYRRRLRKRDDLGYPDDIVSLIHQGDEGFAPKCNHQGSLSEL
jgi:hypothetical protein